jgi:hypothetical protein
MAIRLGLVAALAAAVALSVGSDRQASAQQPGDPRDAAIRVVASQTGVQSSRLVAVTTAPASYPPLGIVAVAVKVLDSRTGAVHSVVLDASGQALDAERLVHAQRLQRAAQGVPLEPDLVAWLANAAPEEPVPVVVWLREPSWLRPARLAPARAGSVAAAPGQRRAQDAAAAAVRLAAVQPLLAPVLSRLRSAGVPATTAGAAPAIWASVPAAILAEVGTWPEIERVHLSRTNEPDLDLAGPTIHANVVHAQGISGQGVQIAQIEPGGRVATSNPYLAGIEQDLTYACATASEHATAVAGVLRSTHPALRGIAPGSSLRVGGSCLGSSGELNNRAAAAVDWGARVLSLSYGYDSQRVPGADDRFYDDLAFNRHVVIVKSAGNWGQTTGNVGSPGLGYNVLTVGNFDDRDTVALADDAMHPTSSYRGPLSTHGDRRKPELAAPGTNIRSLSLAPPWDTFSSTGSSFATPMVAGTVALMLQRNAELAAWPEAVKAIAMASAANALQGNASLASRGGVGGIVADRADDVVQRANGDWGAQPYDCDSAATFDVAPFRVLAGQRARAVLVWASNPNWGGWPSAPGADLDLTVIGPERSVVGVSASFDNSFELVEFVASTSAEYSLRVSRTRCDSSPTGVAWAWHVTSPAAPTATPTSSPTPVPPTATATRTLIPPTQTLTPAPPPACTPARPSITVTVTPSGGTLSVTVGVETLPGSPPNRIQALRFGAAANALIEVGGQPGRGGNFIVTLPAPTAQTSFVVRHAAAGAGTTVPLTVIDGCGEWPTLVGGGPQSF